MSDQFENKEDFIKNSPGEMLWWREQWKNKDIMDIPDTALDTF